MKEPCPLLPKERLPRGYHCHPLGPRRGNGTHPVNAPKSSTYPRPAWLWAVALAPWLVACASYCSWPPSCGSDNLCWQFGYALRTALTQHQRWQHVGCWAATPAAMVQQQGQRDVCPCTQPLGDRGQQRRHPGWPEVVLIRG